MQFSIAVVALLAAVSCMETSAEIGADPLSLAKIMLHLCTPWGHKDPVAKDFYGCYDQTPAQKEGFSACMVKAFGAILDTEDRIDVPCSRPWKMATYVTCLKETFEAEELKAAVDTINKCQAKVVGVN